MILSMLGYYRSLGLTMKESIKRATDRAAYYYTSRRSVYSKPEETVSVLQVPTKALLLTLACRWNAASWLRPYAKLGVLLWRCGEATHSAARNNYGKTWHSTRVYLPETVCGIRRASNFIKHLSQRTNWRSCRKQKAPLERKRMRTESPMSSIPAATKRLKRKMLSEEIHSFREKLKPLQPFSLVPDLDLAELFASTIVSCPDQGKK